MSESGDDSEKTEDPTGKRLGDARDKGQVANSREVNHLFMILALTLTVLLFGSGIAGEVTRLSLPFIEAPETIPTDLESLIGIAWRLFGLLILAGIGPLVLALMAAFGAGYLQFGLIWSTESLTFDLSKISPMAGFKRIFSLRSVTELLKGLLKIGIVAVVAGFLLLPAVINLNGLIGLEMGQLIMAASSLVAKLLIGVFAVIAVVTVFDVIYQRYEHNKQLRMSRQELKDEMKQTEGDPLIKGRLRQLRMERARRRMMAEVPKADVVITNPTHYAVALRYDQATMHSPQLIAKGVDRAARKIREIAEEHRIPIVENPPLARGLYASVDLDREVPAEFYKAVAEVIGYIYRLRRRRF